MTKLFDKITGTITSYNSSSVSNSNANFKTDYYKGWFIVLGGVEYKIISNTTTSLFFENSIASNLDYSIEFVGRSFLTELESDCSNSVKIPDSLIDNKYNQANSDIHNKVFSYLKGYYKTNYDPLTNIFNLVVMQQSFAYYLLAKIYQDLMIDQESFESFKGYNMYEKSYIEGVKDSLSLLQLDINADGKVDAKEKSNSPSTYTFLSR